MFSPNFFPAVIFNALIIKRFISGMPHAIHKLSSRNEGREGIQDDLENVPASTHAGEIHPLQSGSST
jgi:hypothetical protein